MELDRTETFNPESIKLAKCYIDNDLVNEYDNQALQVADYKNYNYTIDSVNELMGTVGDTGILTSTVSLDEEVVEEKVYWYSSDENIVSINKETGLYQMHNLGEATIYAKMANNENFYKKIFTKVSNQQLNIYKNVISPSVEYIPLNSTQEYEVYETLNGNKTDTKFEIIAIGMKDKYYNFVTNGNTFKITNILQNQNNLLQIKCKNLRDNSNVELEIELGGLF